MSFYTKYQELGLENDELISWLTFDSNITDSGPNGNVWTYHVGSGVSLLASPGTAHFTTEAIKLLSPPTSFTAFFDIEKVDASDDQCVLSTVFSGGNFAFIWGPSGNFYVCSKNEAGELTYVGFLRVMEPSKRCIFALCKFESSFLMYLYDPFADTIETELLTIPSDKFYIGGDMLIGDKTYGYGADSNFKIREFSLIYNGIPGFCVVDLCREIYNNSADDNFKFAWVAVSDKSNSFYFEQAVNTSNLNTNIVLPYSLSPEGFSLLGNEISLVARVFKDGYEIYPTFESGYITYPGMSPDDEVVADFYDGSEGLGTYDLFSGAIAAVVPRGAAVIYTDPEGERTINGYKLISAVSLSSGADFAFPVKTNLVEI